MSRLTAPLAAAFLLMSCGGTRTAELTPMAVPRLAIHAARLLDPASGTLRGDVVVVVEGSRVVEVTSASQYRPRRQDEVIRLGNVTLLPGLIDAHVHLSIGGPPRAAALATVRAGFTTIADLGAPTQRVQVVRDSIDAGVWEGPRVLAAGLWIGIKDGVCEFGGLGIAGGPEAFRQRVRQNVAAGANLIKVCVSGWPAAAFSRPREYELPDSLLAAVVEESRRLRRKVVAHAISPGAAQASLRAGVAGLAHAAYLDSATAIALRDRGVFLIPTLASLTGRDSSAAGRALVESTRLAHTLGVRLVFGTDGGVLPHGQNAQEFVALARAGIPPLDAIRMATVNAAAALGVADSVGTIAPGMSADIIAVDGDPLVDLSALSRPRFVMLRGRVVRVDQ